MSEEPSTEGRQVDPVDFEPYEEMMAKQQATKKRRLLVAGVVGIAVIGGGGFYAVAAADAASKSELARSWAGLNACLFGARQSEAASAASAMRNLQLTVMGLPEPKRGEPGKAPWPRRCAPHAHSISEALSKAGGEAPLTKSSKALADALDAPTSYQDDLSQAITTAWTDAAALDIADHAVEGDPPSPPEAAAPMTVDTLDDAARFLPKMVPLDRLHPEPTPSGRLRFVVDEKGQPELPAVCDVIAEGKNIQCKTLPKALGKYSPGLRLWGTIDDATPPLLFAGERGKSGIFRSTDGERIAEGLTYGAYARKDGSLMRTVWHDEKKEVWYSILDAEGKESRKSLLRYDEVGNPYYNSGLFWDWLIYKARVRDKGIQLLARKVSDNGQLGPLTEVGELAQPSLIEPDDEPHVAACRDGNTLVIRVKGKTKQYIATFADGRWTPPVEATGRTGTLTCHDGEAYTVRLTANARAGKYWPDVLLNRCTRAKCTYGWINFKTMLGDVPDLAPVDKEHITAAEVGGKLLLLWGAGEQGGLRMRLAPVERIPKTPDRVVYDDLVEKGRMQKTSTLIATRVIPGRGFALLFLSTGRGMFVYRVDAEGKIAPAKTTFG